MSAITTRSIDISVGREVVSADLTVPSDAAGLVIFAHGSGSSRLSPRNRFVAQVLVNAGFATLLLDLLTSQEEAFERHTGELRFDIGLLASRLGRVAGWARQDAQLAALPFGLFGASTGGGAALVAAAERPDLFRAVVSRGGRPDLAGAALGRVQAPTLLVVGAHDPVVVRLNEEAYGQLRGLKRLAVVPGATHLFEEPGALEHVAQLAADWFGRHLAGRLGAPA